ncbi:hypothetical protein, partial [Methylomonas koyamae]|uniref:hypothetical protein n=1 Tax=Methylomonas koyamae TaxID=702114 RepID=UPI001E62859D
YRLFKFAPGKFVLGQRKVTKRKATRNSALILRFSLLSRVFGRGFLPLRKRAACPKKRGRLSLPLPYGLISPKAAMLGAE